MALWNHGDKRTPEYDAWIGMKRRCNNPNSSRYKDYGGRGITVCERWMVVENFLTDMGERPTIEHSLDRKNNEGNYEPSNCRWATHEEQNQNQRLSKNNKSGYSGVFWNKRASKWQVQITVKAKNKHLGFYENLKDAIVARKEAEVHYWGKNDMAEPLPIP